MMGCCRSRLESPSTDDKTNVHVNLLQVAEELEAGESELGRADEGGLPGADSVRVQEQQLSREEMPVTRRSHSEPINISPAPESEAAKERPLTMSMISERDHRYWEHDFKGT